jgi:hypothetical protein
MENMIRSTARSAAFTLVEVVVGAGVALVGLLAVTALNSANLRYVASARQSNAATLCLQERAEQLRLADWRKITSATYLQNTLLANTPKSAAPLGQLAEKIIVSAFPDDTVAQKLIVERTVSGSRNDLVSGEGLAAQRMAKIEFQTSWVGADRRLRTRATTTLMTNGGISRMNLPSFGGNVDGTTGTTTTTPTSDPTATPSPWATPTPTPTPTPAPANNGNGNGRGNVGGKSGKN